VSLEERARQLENDRAARKARKTMVPEQTTEPPNDE
jgi:hypothetical protein